MAEIQKKVCKETPTFIFPSILFSTWTSVSSLGVTLNTWSLKHRVELNKNERPALTHNHVNTLDYKDLYYIIRTKREGERAVVSGGI